MVWFKVDDKLPDHRKARRLRKSHPEKRRDASPFGLWTLAGAWCGWNRTGGFVPTEILEDWDDDAEELAARLVTAGLWLPGKVDDEPGFWFHDWADQNPRDGVDQGDYGRRGNHIRWHQKRSVIDPDCDFCNPDGSGSDRGDHRGESGDDSPRPAPPRPEPAPTAAAAAGDAAAADRLPVAIEILRSRLQSFTKLQALRFDTLDAAATDRLVALIEIHGDARLAQTAIDTCRAVPPTSVTAFLGTWEALPAPGQRLRVLQGPACPVHPAQGDPAASCRACASERLAGEA